MEVAAQGHTEVNHAEKHQRRPIRSPRHEENCIRRKDTLQRRWFSWWIRGLFIIILQIHAFCPSTLKEYRDLLVSAQQAHWSTTNCLVVADGHALLVVAGGLVVGVSDGVGGDTVGVVGLGPGVDGVDVVEHGEQNSEHFACKHRIMGQDNLRDSCHVDAFNVLTLTLLYAILSCAYRPSDW